jgi:DNA-binding MarR family transcriptional regulator
MSSSEQTPLQVQQTLMGYSLAHFIEISSWSQHVILRLSGLEPLHLAFLRRAHAHGKVSFDRIKHDTGATISSISRAATFLEECHLGSVRPDKLDKRRRRFHINAKGIQARMDVDTKIGRMMEIQIRRNFINSRRAYQFTIYLWNLTRFLPESRLGMPDIYCESKMIGIDTFDYEKLTMEQFMKDLQTEPRLDIDDSILD